MSGTLTSPALLYITPLLSHFTSANKLSLTSVEDQGPVRFSIEVQRLPSIKQPANQPTYHHRVTIAFDKKISPACLSTVETERRGTREGKQTAARKKEQRYGNSSLSLRPQSGLFSVSSTAIPASIEDSKKRKKGARKPGVRLPLSLLHPLPGQYKDQSHPTKTSIENPLTVKSSSQGAVFRQWYPACIQRRQS
ncbi:hypothetical protein TRV_02615 [Trichophyton verrucosum HKI 0517]|uniref:Uncharacterized protein n=1 Tax=Trichophyton verrucosum (strain HKI 0517) TaxID=663202 RepID=D4D692_TRIVH|nr:uncharacterized protein TRV_02615 [Trichophyton verrucosum HKI 0517]EFE42663.1 hypothetical protein TRV_02615 [Trichophyton verrucosum HKI 0517]